MRRQLAVPLALLFIALGVPSNAQNAGDEAPVSVEEGAPLTVECALPVAERAEWRLDGAPVPADLRPAGEAAAGGRLTARLHAAAARPHHGGVYTCAPKAGQRIRVHVRPAPLRAHPDAAETATTPAAETGVETAAAPDSRIVMYYILGHNFTLNCSSARSAGATTVVWKKNNTLIEEQSDLRDRYKLEDGGFVFTLPGRTNENDFGNYTCARGDGSPVLAWDVRGRPVAKVQANSNVVEKQSVKIICKMAGKPYPPVAWTVSNSTEENGTDVHVYLGERVKLQRSEQGVENGELVLSAAERSDAGLYTCTPLGAPDALTSSTTLRVKDQYAALWPFLGICAEVFVLCAIILVYEKRRTKPELDDSDTDNHDQKKS